MWHTNHNARHFVCLTDRLVARQQTSRVIGSKYDPKYIALGGQLPASPSHNIQNTNRWQVGTNQSHHKVDLIHSLYRKLAMHALTTKYCTAARDWRNPSLARRRNKRKPAHERNGKITCTLLGSFPLQMHTGPECYFTFYIF